MLAATVAAFAQAGLQTSKVAAKQQRGPRVDVICPVDPMPVRAGAKQIFAYELHITNFEAKPLMLQRVTVSAGDTAGDSLAAYSVKQLADMLNPVGLHAAGSKGAVSVDPGERTILFLWIALEANREPPGYLHHRIVFTDARVGQASKSPVNESTLEDFPVPVRKEVPPRLGFPFVAGTWFAGDGPSNRSPHRRAVVALEGHARIAQRFAIDWIKIGPNGNSYHDAPTRNENWWGYGEPIHAVADGEVTQVVDDIPENTARKLPEEVTLHNIAGNCVVMRIAPRTFVTYAHLQKSSIKVHPGQQVRQGDVIALLGNSGNATAPHLHLQVTDGDAVLASEGLPFEFEAFQYLGPGSEYELERHISVQWVRSMPVGDAVIEIQTNK